jgi:hypothetical protein
MITCINKSSKFKNLTVGKNYDGELVGDDYIVTNDAGMRTRYAPKYFRVVPTIRNLADITRISVDHDGGDISINVYINDVHHRIDGLSHNYHDNSCGIEMFSGVERIKRQTLRIWGTLNTAEIAETQQELFRMIIEALLVYLRTVAGAWITITNVVEEIPNYDIVLDNLADVTLERLNTNSNHVIKLWIFNK